MVLFSEGVKFRMPRSPLFNILLVYSMTRKYDIRPTGSVHFDFVHHSKTDTSALPPPHLSLYIHALVNIMMCFVCATLKDAISKLTHCR